jgi:hypothetical protein
LTIISLVKFVRANLPYPMIGPEERR